MRRWLQFIFLLLTALASRTNTYSYHSANSPYAGLLQTRTDGRGVTCAYTYDDWLRAATNTHTGSLPEHNLTTIQRFDARGLGTNLTESFASTNTGPTVIIRRSYDAYRLLTSELIYTNGVLASSASQSWDSAGRRFYVSASLSAQANGSATYVFNWRADALLTAALGHTGGGTYSYNDAGQIISRTLGSRTTTVTSRDGVGRPLSINTTINGVNKLAETITWSGDGLPATHGMAREDFTDSRAYTYGNSNRRLIEERLNLDATGRWTNALVYDNAQAAGPGALTKVGQASSPAQWSGNADAFGRIGSETNNVVARTAFGRVNGPAAITVSLDGRPMPVVVLGTGNTTWTNTWRATLEMTPGAHQLTATARHPSGLFTTNATIWLTNSIGNLTETNVFDLAGYRTQCIWKNPNGTTNRIQNLFWDARGRLFKVSDRLIQHSNTVAVATNGVDFTTTYDAFGRLLRTVEIVITNSVALTSQPIVIEHTYDPEHEFLELGVSENGRTTWKLMGPDMDGRYGGQNGTGGFDAFIPGPELFCPILGDAFGNLHAVYDQTHGSLTWYASRVTGYGAVPGYRPVPLGTASADLGAKEAWRNRWTTSWDGTWMGGTWLRPNTGETLSFDPYGHDSSDTGHTPFRGNPIGYHWDPDGRLGRSAARTFDSAWNFVGSVAFTPNPEGANTQQREALSQIFIQGPLGSPMRNWFGAYEETPITRALVEQLPSALTLPAQDAMYAYGARPGVSLMPRAPEPVFDGTRPGFYVTPDGVAVPSTGYRAIGGPLVAEAQAGIIESRNPTYITFNNITRMSPNEASSSLQLFRTPTHAAIFDTLQIANQLRIPTEYGNQGLFPEPFTVSYPRQGSGGASQAITYSPIQGAAVVPLIGQNAPPTTITAPIQLPARRR